jgi:hypothetical protein
MLRLHARAIACDRWPARSWEEAFPDVEAVLDEALSLVERMLARSVLEIDRVK